MGAPKLKKSSIQSSEEKKRDHLKLVEDKKNAFEAKLHNRQINANKQKAEIEYYKEMVEKSLDDPEMVKKAAMLLMQMLEK
jgi:hypothetical protein